MSFPYFRDRPRLSDRMRGKSGDELFKELRKEIDQDRQMFFDRPSNLNFRSSPAGSTFPRAGHMFDDNMMRGDIRSHLDDLAARHPEFADHLQPWGDMQSNTWGRKRRGSGSQAENGEPSKQHQQSQSSHENTEQDEKSEDPGPLRGRTKENLSQFGLRNTVPDMGMKQQNENEEKERGQRSWSAPPDNRSQTQDKPQRFVSKIEITPVNPNTPPPTSDSAKPPVAPKQPQQPQPQVTNQQPTQKQSNVRHIPIFVEGRSEPVIPKDIEQDFIQTQAQPQQFAKPPPSQQQPFNQQQIPQHFQQQQFQEEPINQTQFQQVPPKPGTKNAKDPQPEPVLNQRDPLVRVQIVQKDVDDLKSIIEEFKGNSRTDKDYIYLDEMLTRNLIKLDDIETDGKENVRAARKEAIKSIQRCISILENKAPIQTTEKDITGNQDGQKMEGMETLETTKDEKMDIQQEMPKSETKEPSVEKQMEIEPISNETKATSNDAKEEPASS